MKNFMLASSGILIGMGINAATVSKDDEENIGRLQEGQRTRSFYYIGVGALLLIGSLTLFNKK